MAIAADGTRSTATAVGTNAPPAVASPPDLFDPTALDASLPLLFDVLNALPVERVQAAGDRLFDALNGAPGAADSLGLTVEESFLEEPGSTIVSRYSCAGGGSLAFRAIGRGGTVLADDCTLPPVTYDGEFGRPRGPGTTDEASIDGFSVRDGDSQATLTATTSVGVTSELGFGERRVLDVETFESGGTGADPLRLSDYRLVFGNDTAMTADRTVTRTFAVEGTLVAPWAGDAPVEVRTPEPFTSTAPADTYAAGRITVSDAAGRTLTLRGGDGNPAVYRVDIEADGVATSVFRRWGGSEGLRCVVFETGLDADPACR